jgi:hypothetical protein
VVGVCKKEEKSANVHVVAFFNPKAVSCRPAANMPQQGALSPPRLSSYIMLCVIHPTASKSDALLATSTL